MAEYMIVDTPRRLVPIGDLDPVRAASLTDAALTPYQAILSVLPKLRGGSTTVVIGVGGLGHVAVQLLRELTGTRIIAMDVTQEKLDLAKECGAHEVLPSGPEAAEAVKKLTGGRGAHVVFDFVGLDKTSELAVACAGVESHVVIVGAGGGGVKIGFLSVPYNTTVSTSLWGGRAELGQLVTMAQRGQIHIQTRTFSLDQVPEPTGCCTRARSSAGPWACPRSRPGSGRSLPQRPSGRPRPQESRWAAWIAVRAIVYTMSSTRAPRDRSFTGLASPCSIGPMLITSALR